MKLNNINLKKVVPIALLTIVILVVTISLTTCGKKDNKTKNNGKETETNDTVKETKDNNEGNGSIFDYLNEDNTSDDKTSLTVDDNQTENSNTTGSTANNEQSIKKPSSSDKTTSSNIGTKPVGNQTTSNNISGSNNNNNNNNNQQTGNEIIEIGLDAYAVSENIQDESTTDSEDYYIRYEAEYRWYNLYLDGTKEWDTKAFTVELVQSINFDKVDFGDFYKIYIYIEDLEYKYTNKFNGMKGKKSNELYNKYYIDEYATKNIDESERYIIECIYYIDKMTNKSYDDYEELGEVLGERYINNLIIQLGINNSSMSREKKIWLISDYIEHNWEELRRETYFASQNELFVFIMNKIGIKSYLVQEVNNGPIIKLIQMEDNLWYGLSWNFDAHIVGGRKELLLSYISGSSLTNYPNGITFATPQTSNLVFRDMYINDTGYYTIKISDITY